MTAKVFVTGASELPKEHEDAAKELGRRLMLETEFTLVTGGLASKKGSNRRALDKVVADAAFEALGHSVESSQARIVTVLPEADNPSLERFTLGSVIRLSYASTRSRRYSMVLTSDAVVAVNGADASREVLDLAYISGKPLIPLATTGGTSLECWTLYQAEIVRRLHLSGAQVAALTDAASPTGAVSACLSALRQVLRPRCFVAMPFADHPLANAFETIRAATEELGFQAIRVDQESFIGNIVEAIWDSIRHCDIVIADLSGHRPNVYYELGIGHALGKPTLLLVFSENGDVPSDIPFDIRIQRIVPYGTTQSLRAQLRKLLPAASPAFRDSGRAR